MPFLIDGYNLLWAIQQTNKDSSPLSDVQLCRILGRFLKLISETGEIVFDNVGPPDKSGFENVTNLEIIFAGRGKDADSLIEEKIIANTAPKRLTVVSSDRRLCSAAHARKAISVKSENFWADVRRQLNKKIRQQEPLQKEIGLTEGETKQWLKIFDIEK